jgi:class 3 adenylate cyclase
VPNGAPRRRRRRPHPYPGKRDAPSELGPFVVGSTEQQARLGQRQWSQLTDRHDAMVRAALTRCRGHEIKTTGDGFLATFDATGRALRCASEILTDAKGIGVELRAGPHTGDVKMRGDDVTGLSVSIAKRVCDLAKPGQLLVSETVRGAVPRRVV